MTPIRPAGRKPAKASALDARAMAEELDAIRERVRRNEPRHRDPERFHIEKSEITGLLTAVINRLRNRS